MKQQESKFMAERFIVMALFWQVALSLTVTTQCFAQIFSDPEVVPATSNNGPTYQFKYRVHDVVTMDFKSHEEFAENGTVRGTYSVREPNGNLRVVSYVAGDSGGFQVMVRVRPANLAEAEAEQALNQTATPEKQEADAPLKIQLDSGRRIYQTRQQEQRQNNSTKRAIGAVVQQWLPLPINNCTGNVIRAN